MPATLISTSDGSPSLFSSEFNASYHSIHGAWTETEKVFIQAGLDYMAMGRDEVSIFEVGFGSGLNALATLKYAGNHKVSINYTTIEKFPISEAVCNLLAQFWSEEYSSDLSMSFLDMHGAPHGKVICLNERYFFKKLLSDLLEYSPNEIFQVIFFDAFAPETQPEMWTLEVFSKMFDLLEEGGVLVTYCAKGEVKRTMRQAGFTIEILTGPPGKREMTRGIKAML